MTGVVVHHLNNSRSQRILWLLEELGVPYQIKKYQRDKKTNLAPKELEEVHPLGKSPVLTDGSNTVAETGAIIEYIVDKYGDGKLKPSAGSQDRLQYTYWLHFAEGSAMQPVILTLLFSKLPSKSPFFLRPITSSLSNAVLSGYVRPNSTKQLQFINSELAKQPWFAGREFSAADVIMSFPLEASQAQGNVTKEKTPKIVEFLETIHARPAYKAALEKGGEYDLNL